MPPDTSGDLPVRDTITVDEATPIEAFIRSVEEGDVPLIGVWNRIVPLFAPPHLPTWALLNLIMSALGIIYAAGALLYVIFRKKYNEDEQELEEDEPHTTIRKKGLLIAIVMAVIGVILFVLTQDMRNIMILFDWWTLIHMIIFLIEVVAIVHMIKRKKDDGGDEEEEDRHVSGLRFPAGYSPQPSIASPAVNNSS